MVTAAPQAPASGRLAERLRPLATWTNLWSAAFFVTLVLVRFTPPRAERSIKLDHSWQQAYTYFHTRGFQAGIDYVFTYGPLAHLDIGHFSADQFWTRVLAWQLGLGSAVALILVALARRIPTIPGRGAFTLLLLFAAQVPESYWLLAITGACAWLLGDAGGSRARLALGLAVLAAASLVKYPYFVLSGLGVVALAAAWTITRGKGAGALVVAGFTGLLGAAWLAAGQRLDAFPAYVATSNELTRGYAQAMHLPATGYALVLAGITVTASLAWFATWTLARPLIAIRFLGGAVLAAATLLAYKSSFVLYDRDGAYFLFAGVAVLLPFTFPDPAPSSAWPARIGIVLCTVTVVACLLGAPSVLDGVERWPRRELLDIPRRCADSLDCLGDLRGFERTQVQAVAENAGLHALPRTKALVDTQPIDFFGVHQALLLQAGFHYSPRPVFQNYAAFTPALMELNRSFYEGPRAPPFVAVSLQPLPYHMPAMEDGLALQSLVRGYEPVLSERGLMLWRQRAPAARAEVARTVVLERSVPVGEWLELGELEPATHLARIEIEPTLLGRLRDLAYQPAPLFLEIRTRSRNPLSFVIGLEQARSEWILDPVIGNQRDLARWVAGLRTVRPRAIRLVTDGPFHGREARILIERAADLRPEPPPELAGEAAARELVYPEFATLPVSESLNRQAHTGWVSGHEVLVVGAPSELVFDVPPGDWRLRGAYGCEPAPDVFPSDGIDFQVVDAKDGRTLFQGTLDPRHKPADRAMRPLDVLFRCESPTKIVLRTVARTPIKIPGEGAYWCRLGIEPAAISGDGAGD